MLATRLRLWFGLSDRVDRRTYFVTGLGLMALKYLSDSAVVWAYTGRTWSPLDYANPVWFVHERALRGVPPAVMLALAVWALPFIWIGVGMSVRRAADAGLSPWLALLFFIPFVNYLLMLGLCLPPTNQRRVWWQEEPEPVMSERWRSGLLGVAGALAITIPSVLLSVYWKRNYSVGLFLGTPFTIGAISAHIYNRRHPRSIGDTIKVVLIALVLAGGTLLLFAAEGGVCLAMAFPIAALVAILGGLLGRAIAVHGAEPPSRVGLAALLAPLLVAVEPPASAPPREVVTVVEIAAPPDVVWRSVVTFPEVPPPTEAVFRVGVAAPLRARIQGRGVGAVRYCDFTTGSFVEPITRWEENRVLGFAITGQAPPMREWSPYRNVNPPHLDGYFRATHGEFRLTPLPGGRTRLEGRTWYEVRMAPQAYWTIYADVIVRSIHERVLRHIKTLAEKESR
ncbi:MAG: hypothetical protein DMD29_05250 [Gemmatimonadetes bacterium]|nr:MAG: hypothetical protein DMD29_05250 [Gemmatimonadota bacterium]